MEKYTRSKHQPFSIAAQYSSPKQKEMTIQVAERLDIPLASKDERVDFLLRCSEEGLELFQTLDPSLTGSVRAEFVRGPSGYRRQKGGAEMLIRAIGHKTNMATSVLDATGGLGRDAFIMASHGCRVHVIEKNPIIAALLEDGLKRAGEKTQTKATADRITMSHGDSVNFLSAENKPGDFDVIYLDPMFPIRNKSARVKKELQILQILVGHEDAPDELFKKALLRAGKRVVVKRPKTAPFLLDRKPSYSLSGKTIRFDVYLASG